MDGEESAVSYLNSEMCTSSNKLFQWKQWWVARLFLSLSLSLSLCVQLDPCCHQSVVSPNQQQQQDQVYEFNETQRGCWEPERLKYRLYFHQSLPLRLSDCNGLTRSTDSSLLCMRRLSGVEDFSCTVRHSKGGDKVAALSRKWKSYFPISMGTRGSCSSRGWKGCCVFSNTHTGNSSCLKPLRQALRLMTV